MQQMWQTGEDSIFVFIGETRHKNAIIADRIEYHKNSVVSIQIAEYLYKETNSVTKAN